MSAPEETDAPFQRLLSYLDAAPFPLPPNIDLERAAKRLAKDPEALSLAGPKITVHILSSSLSDYLVNHLILMFARRGLAADIRQGDYGVIAGAIFDEANLLHTAPPDLFLILPNFRDLAHCPPLGATPDQEQLAVDAEVEFWCSLWARLPAPAVQLSFDTPALRHLGEIDGFTPGGLTRHVRLVNLALATRLPAALTLVDAEALAQCVGHAHWHDPHVYHLCKQPYAFAALPQVADALSAAAAGLLGKGRKVLVLDLDNTLWGGIIGDDGLDALELGPETPEGEAFTAFQHYVLQLRRRGVVLAVCSKNQDAIAREAFQRHPAMVLKEADIACFVVNFNDKATNIRIIAEQLNVGLDALVFVDDNPVERALVRRELPQVLTVELPENPAHFASALEDSRAFPLAYLTNDDLHRAASYTARASTTKAMASTADMDGFLAGLEARAIVEPIGPGSMDRIMQLLAKTNQFKLNPSTFTATELEAHSATVIALRLIDKLQDYGIVTVAVLTPDQDDVRVLCIRNWVMSCRVFSRRLEFVMFEEILNHARKAQANTIRLTYTVSARNGLVADLLPKLGFVSHEQHDTFTAPVLGVNEVHTPPHHMEIVRPSSH